MEQTLNNKLGLQHVLLHVRYFGPKMVDRFVWKMLSYHVGRKMKRSPDKWRQSLARLWWTPSMVSCFIKRLKQVLVNCEDWWSALCLDKFGSMQSNWSCSIFDKQMDPYETFRWYFHTSWLLWWRQFLFWFFVCSTFDNRMETWTVDRSLCWFDHRDWAAYGVARPPGSKQENPAKSNINQLCIIIFILIFFGMASFPSHLLFLFCFGQAMDVVETIQHQPNLHN